MSKYTVYFDQVASTAVEVEADDYDEAIEKAEIEAYIEACICHQCARHIDLSGDWEPESVYETGGREPVWERRP